MVRRFFKHKLLLDENMPPRGVFPRLNEHFDVKHVDHDLSQGGIKDASVYELARTASRIIVTQNVKHFKPLAGGKSDAGVIGVPPHWQPKQVDSQLTALLMRHRPGYFRGRYISLGE
ncbi:DUF5615 family PIN-like protein [Streptomyces cinerochromogenes]|uniref:DUF5615 family PIN-like protein n=1 Tax=Streptomyces cinerochromogenes TaxID=66422 RepID=UPI00166FA131|nr:DUF5615 family PIN-like protein [Streptomyces cinerochromogenes]GGS82851.1 hypothetical protein GCM10010206_51780 [Streptomyces cinerochromogenes]